MSRWNKNVRNRRFDALSRVDWRDFERLLADYYRRQGYRVEHCGTGVNSSRFDGGIDLKLYRDDAYLVVQCKHWNVRQVPHNAMHELAGIMLTEGATGAILVTSGEFTAHARESSARVGNMQLVDGEALRGMLGPIPEPALQPRSLVAPPEDRAARILAEVGGRALQAAARRIGYGSRGRRSRAAVASIWGPLIQFALVAGTALAFIAFVAWVISPTLLRGSAPTGQSAPGAQSAAGTRGVQASGFAPMRSMCLRNTSTLPARASVRTKAMGSPGSASWMDSARWASRHGSAGAGPVIASRPPSPPGRRRSWR